MIRKTPDGFLAENDISIGRDVKNAAAAGDELGFHAELLLNRLRQTGGSREVVSLRAVGDRDFHK